MARKQVLCWIAAAIAAATVHLTAEAGNGRGNGKPTSPTTGTATEVSSVIVDQGGYPNSVAVDPFGRPCAAYFVGRELRFAVFDGVSWKKESLGLVGGDFGATWIDLAVDALGHPAIAFSVNREGGAITDRISVASHDGASWKIETIDIHGSGPSIAIGSGGGKLVAYARSNGDGTILKLAESSGSGWSISTVDSTNASGGSRYIIGPSIAVDGLGNVGISYSHHIWSVSKQIRYAYGSAGAWTITPMWSEVADMTDLAFDSSNRPRIAYWAKTLGTMNILYNDGQGSWSNSRLPWKGTSTAGKLSLAIDPSGRAYLTAFDSGSGDLHFISGVPGEFGAQVLASTGYVGKSNSLHVNRSTGQKCVTFSDQTTGVLKFMAF